ACCWSTTSSTRATRSRRSSTGARTRARSTCGSRCSRPRPTTAAWTTSAPTTAASRCPTATCSATAWTSTSRGATCRGSTHSATDVRRRAASDRPPPANRTAMTSDQIELAVIGGTGLYALAELRDVSSHQPDAPYGTPSGPVRVGTLGGRRVAFLARHGESHSVPPHKVNYRANLAALRVLGARQVLALN